MVYILEFTPRIGGNSISKLIKSSCGFDIIEYSIREACGVYNILHEKNEEKPRAILILGVPSEGKLSYNIDEYEKLKLEPWVVHLSITKKNGDSVKPFMNGRLSIGEALILGKNRIDLEKNAFDVYKRLCLNTES